MSQLITLELWHVFLIVVSSLAVTFLVMHRIFPPMERIRDIRDLSRESGLPTRPQREPDVASTPESSVQEERLAGYRAPPWLGVYWKSNLMLIGPLLLIWLASFLLPAIFAPMLNQVTVLTGFPLGYYMQSQGALIIFIGLTFGYTLRMRKLDRRFGMSPPESATQRNYRNRLLIAYLGFTLGFLALIGVVSLLDAIYTLPPGAINWFFLLITIGVYAVIGLRARTEQLDEYYVAGRRVPALFNGLATGSDWMSAASFISMAGALFLLGYEGLAYITGWTGGFVLLVLLLAPYLRKFGQFTIPDFIGARYPGSATRVLGAIICIIISFTYLTAQVTGIGIIMSRFLGINYMLGVIVGLSAVLLCSFLGGMKAITWTQGVQGIIMVVAYLVPVTWLSLKLTGVPIPQLMYGEALQNIIRLEAEQGITSSYIEPFNDWSPLNFIALTICLMVGTAGMPHILTRFYTVPNVHQSRSSVAWALGWIAVLYLTAPAYAAFSRWEILQDVVGRPIAALPEWAENWAQTGLLTITETSHDENGNDSRLQYDELRIDPDLIVLATPEIAGLPTTVVALVAAGGMAAALSTADGLLMVIAAAVAHDIYHRTLNPKASLRERLWLGRIMILVAAVLATLTALQRLAIIVQMVAWAFSLAAATFFPILVMGIFWKRATSRGAAAGMLSGLIVTAGYMALTSILPNWSILGISSSAAGIFGIPINALVTWLVSRFDTPPSLETQAMVDSLRHP